MTNPPHQDIGTVRQRQQRPPMLSEYWLEILLATLAAAAVVGYLLGLKRGKDAAVDELLARRWTMPSDDDDDDDD